MKVLEIMTRLPVATSPAARLLDAAEAMLSANVSALPVVSGDQLVGIITEGDLMRRWEAGTDRKYPGFATVKVGVEKMAADFVRSHGGYVRELMTKNCVSVDEETLIEDAIRLFERHGFKQLPVTSGKKFSGIITRRNILESFVRNARRISQEEHSDEDIKRAILAIYTREPWAPLAHIDLCVRDGVVEILGDVEAETQRQAVVAAAEGVPGVKRVVDHLSSKAGDNERKD
ncbi:CBS domain-containing protein [Taklimakanibacter deserti]|uniref:CBS domain-containing protein n=1 Tax=Taklimakanibacter deserti TaxID=2267839 RepID=UPI000E65A2DF